MDGQPMPSPRCPRCGCENETTFAFCQGCGQTLLPPAQDHRRCPGCGAKVERTFRFCGHCGLPLADVIAPPGEAEDQPPVLQRRAKPVPAAPYEGAQAAAFSAGPQQAAPKTGRSVRLIPIRADGLPAAAHALGAEGTVCGRTRGDLRFPDDATVSPEHARFRIRPEGVFVEDIGSLNGTFLRVRAPRPLASGDEVRLGRQLLRVEAIAKPTEPDGYARVWGSADVGYRARLVQLLEGGGAGEVFPLRAGENAIGREAGEVCFPSDRYVSGRHARIDVSDAGMVLIDVGSSNGTFVRISGATQLVPGDQVLVGMQLLRVDA